MITTILKYIKNHDFLYVGFWFALSRGLIIFIAIVATISFNQEKFVDGIPSGIENAFTKFDVGWYKLIAENGFNDPAQIDKFVAGQQSTFGFMPLYPIAVSYIMKLTTLNFFYSSFILSNLASFFAIYIIYKIYKPKLTSAFHFMALVTFSAGSFYLSIGYTESLFLLFVALTIYFSDNKRFLLAGLVVGLATITRIQSIALLIIPIVIILKDNQNLTKKFISSLLVLMIFAIPISGYLFYVHSLTGDPFAYFTSQSAWGNGKTIPFIAITSFVIKPFYYTNVIHFLFWIPTLFMLLRHALKLKVEEILFCLAVIGLSTSTEIFYGTYRYILPLFPLYREIANDKSIYKSTYIYISIGALVMFLMLFISHHAIAI